MIKIGFKVTMTSNPLKSEDLNSLVIWRDRGDERRNEKKSVHFILFLCSTTHTCFTLSKVVPIKCIVLLSASNHSSILQTLFLPKERRKAADKLSNSGT
jgi:hypothetical protein